MELVWLPSPEASCFHSAAAVLDGQLLVDQTLEGSLRPVANALDKHLADDGIDRSVFFDHLVPLSTSGAGSTELARLVLTKTLGGARAEAKTPEYVGAVRDIKQTYSALRPRLAAELPQRAGPLEQQWRARGPGLLREISRLTDESLLVDRAEVLLVEPVLGGGGCAHLLYNSVRIEAVLANPDDRLPEVLRLAWLLALLNLELPMFSERVHRDRLRWVAPLAMLPVVLTAAETVELGSCGLETITLALTAWRVDVPAQPPPAQTVLNWWQTYTASRPSWSVALAALDEMLGSLD
jgi:hypothetical protein